MTAVFDPYYKWLGIPSAEQPPTYYRLLGIRREETDAEVIANAADRMMRQLHKYQSGPQAKLSQKLLNEVAQAKYCLSDPKKRAAYEAILERRQPVASDASHRRSVPPRVTARKRNVGIDSKPKKVSQRLVIIASLVGLAVGLLTAILVVVILRNSLPVQTANNLQSESNPAQSIAPVEIPLVGGGRKVIVQPEISKKDSPTESTQREKESTGTKPTLEDPEEQKEKSSKNAGDDKSPDEKSSESDEEKTTLVKKRPVRFIPLEIAPKDEYSRFRYQKQNGYYVKTNTKKSPKQIPCRLNIKALQGPFIGLCLEAHGAEYESATLVGVEVSSPKVTWRSAADSVGQGGAAALVADETEWTMSYNGKDPIWAVFTAEKPFGETGPHSLKIELDHSDKSQRLPRFRLWGITGSGTLEEMAQAMRDRKRAEKPFAEFLPHGLPEGGTGEVGLGSVFVGSKKLTAQLFGGSLGTGGANFALKEVPAIEDDALQRWEFLLSSDNQQTPVAELVQQGEKLAKLTLRWLPEAAGLPRAADLQNGLLQLQIGEHSRSVPLREVVELVPLTYSPLKTVRPQIQVPAGVAAEDLRLALNFPQATFGVDGSAVLQVRGERGEDVETDILVKDNMVLKFATSWKASVITLSIKTQIQEETEGKAGKKKIKTVPLKKALSELPKLATRIKKGEELLKIIQGVKKYADRSRLKPEEKREIMMINKRWRDFGLNPRIILNEKQAERLVEIVNVEIEKIKNRALKLRDLQEWSKQFGRDGVGVIEFRVYTLIDGVPLDLVRSTGWQS